MIDCVMDVQEQVKAALVQFQSEPLQGFVIDDSDCSRGQDGHFAPSGGGSGGLPTAMFDQARHCFARKSA